MADLLEQLKAALADRYQIDREIGGGGMATVYLAEDLKHHRKVALSRVLCSIWAYAGQSKYLLFGGR
jgi:serine/threonine-protein kinase